MKNIIKYLFLIVIMQLSWSSCEDDKTILPEREPLEDIEEITKGYIETLKSASDGWMLSYKPEHYDSNVDIQMKFQDETVTVLSSYRGYHTEQTGLPYSFEGKYTPIIVFSDESVFGELAQLFNGSQKFKINYNKEEEKFTLIRSDGFDDKKFILEKTNSENKDNLNRAINAVLDEIEYEIEQERLSAETILKLKSFSEINSDFYFYNLETESFSASIDELDTLARTISLTYKESPIANPTSVNLNYSINPKGIILDPAIAYNSVVVDSIEFGELKDPILEIIKAGNTGAGSMGHMHEAPYPITMVTDRSIGSADWFLSDDFANAGANPAIYSLNAEEEYSNLFNTHRAILGEYLEANGTNVKTSTRLVFQMYLYPSTNNIQISTHKQSTTGNWFFPYSFTWDKVPGNSDQIKFNFYETFNLSIGLEDGLDEFFSNTFPEEGVTVMPVVVGTALRIRLISVKDSRIWGEYRINSATNRIPRFN